MKLSWTSAVSGKYYEFEDALFHDFVECQMYSNRFYREIGIKLSKGLMLSVS